MDWRPEWAFADEKTRKRIRAMNVFRSSVHAYFTGICGELSSVKANLDKVDHAADYEACSKLYQAILIKADTEAKRLYLELPEKYPVDKPKPGASLESILDEVLIAIREGLSFQKMYPLLRQVEPLRQERFGDGDVWPGCLLRMADGCFQLYTRHPHLDECYEAEWFTLTDEEDQEIRPHVERVIRAWVRQLQPDQMRLERMTAEEHSQTLDNEPVEVCSWLVDNLNPTPGELENLHEAVIGLAHAVTQFEDRLVGKPIKCVGAVGFEQRCFVELLQALDRVMQAPLDDQQIADGPEPLMIEWEGWLQCSISQRLGIKEWPDLLPSLVWHLAGLLSEMGIPFDPVEGVLGLSFDDSCFAELPRPASDGWTDFSGSKRTCVAEIESEATFTSLGKVNRKSGDNEMFVVVLLETYADGIRGDIDRIATRSFKDRRTLRIDLRKVPRFADNALPQNDCYPDKYLSKDPFKLANTLEGLSGVKLARGGDPIWLLMKHDEYKAASTEFGIQTSFAEYLRNLHPEKLFDATDPDGLIASDRTDEEYRAAEAVVPDEVWQSVSSISDSEIAFQEVAPEFDDAHVNVVEQRKALLKDLNPRHRHALIAFEQAESANTSTDKRFTLDMAWQWVESHYEEYDFTSCQTFKDYVTQARGKVGANVNQPRKGRTGRSIVLSTEL